MSESQSTVAHTSESTPIEQAYAELPEHQQALVDALQAADELRAALGRIVTALEAADELDDDGEVLLDDARGALWTVEQIGVIENHLKGDAGLVRMADDWAPGFAEFTLRRRRGLPISEELRLATAREYHSLDRAPSKGKATA